LRVSKRGMSSYTCTLENGRLLLYISGSCLGNGQDDARGGIGVYWGDDNARNLSRPITDQQVPTNNRAILTAAIHAIRQARKCSCRPLMLKSNNSYLVDSVERFKHIPLWRCTSKSNWTLANGESAKNQDLLKKLHALLRQRGSDVRFERVKRLVRNRKRTQTTATTLTDATTTGLLKRSRLHCSAQKSWLAMEPSFMCVSTTKSSSCFSLVTPINLIVPDIC